VRAFPKRFQEGEVATITISKQLGTLGTEIARQVAEKLNYAFVDKKSLGKMLAAEFGFQNPDLEKFDEKKPPFWDFLSVQRTKYLHSIRAAIYELAREGQVVIVGRGGQVVLKNVPGTLRVRIFAPFAFRVQRLVERERIDEKSAIRKLHQGDHDSAGYIHSFFHADWDDATLYDLLINAEKLSPTTMVDLIVDSSQSTEIQEGVERGRAELDDLALAQKAEAQLIAALGFDPSLVEIRAENGTVILRGSVSSDGLKEKCARVITSMEGVKHVENELTVAQQYYA
jgi:cytidylate kinase